jgi:hypothetical protein
MLPFVRNLLGPAAFPRFKHSQDVPTQMQAKRRKLVPPPLPIPVKPVS